MKVGCKMEKNKLYTKELGWDKKKKAIFLLEELEDNYVVSDLYANQHRLTKPLKEELEEYKYKKGEKTLFSKLIKKIEKLHQNKKKEKEMDAKEILLSDAIETAIESHKKFIKLRRVTIALGIIDLLLVAGVALLLIGG